LGGAAPRLFRPMYAGANMGHPSREEGCVLCSHHCDADELHQGCYPNLISDPLGAVIPANFPYTFGGNSQARHKYQLATERQGFHRAARRSICSALGSISRVIGFPALILPNVKRYPLRIP
jgi:hypothetical protein